MPAHIKASLSDVQTLFLMTEAQIPEEKIDKKKPRYFVLELLTLQGRLLYFPLVVSRI
jgi:hypothetical protein